MDKWPEVFSISIHSAARAETQLDDANGTGDGGISIHSAARAETEALAKQLREMRFQSTPPRGRRRMREEVRPVKQTISIHSAARAETDKLRYNKSVLKFQSTPPRGRRLWYISKRSLIHLISIHSAARAETAIIHNNLYYSPSHFHKQII